MAFHVLIDISCVRFARYCGKMYNRHLFPYGGLNVHLDKTPFIYLSRSPIGDRKSHFVFALGCLCKCMRSKSRLAAIYLVLTQESCLIFTCHPRFPLSSPHKLACRPHFLICDYCYYFIYLFQPKMFALLIHAFFVISLDVLFYLKGIIRPRLRALGMQSGRIRNNQIAASSSWDRYHAAWRARLNYKRQARYRYQFYHTGESVKEHERENRRKRS